jgi:cytoskeletal protein CcmA (bactofilin family)
MWGRRRKPDERAGLAAIVDDGAEIEGRCVFAGGVLLNCRLRGDVVSAATVIIGERAVVAAAVRGRRIVIGGELCGEARASERVEIRSTARVVGEIQAPVIVIEEGAAVRGRCWTGRPETVAAPAEGAVVALTR